jgi:outer membrane lipoprotein-sorting protein
MVAAAVIIFAVGSWGLLGTGHVSFAEILENVQNAGTVSYKVTFYSSGEVVCTAQVMAMGADHMRLVTEDGKAQVMDIRQRRWLTVGATENRAILRNVAKDFSREAYDPLASLRRAHKSDGEFAGQEELDGKLIDVFEVRTKDRTMTVWVDAEVELPVRIEIAGSSTEETTDSLGMTEAVLSDFDWDADLDESLFALTVPPGYVLVQHDPEASTEEDLIDLLRLVAKLSDDTFPGDLNRTAVDYTIHEYLKEKGFLIEAKVGGVRSLETTEEFGPLAGLVTHVRDRGLNFVQRVTDAGGEWYYGGKGVKLGDSDSPVCWWRGLGSTTYRVAYGDLSVKELYADELPPVSPSAPEDPASEN